MRKTLLLLLLVATCVACEKKDETSTIVVWPNSMELGFVAYFLSPYGGGAPEPEIVINSESAWTVTSATDWIKLNKRKGEGVKPDTLSFRVLYNDSPMPRLGYITVSNATDKVIVKINQLGKEELSIFRNGSFDYMYVSKHGGQFLVPCTSTAKDGVLCDSITVNIWSDPKIARYVDGNFIFNLNPREESSFDISNAIYVWKYGAIIARFNITQINVDDYLFLDKDIYDFPATDNPYQVVKIYSSTPWEIQKPDWVMINTAVRFSTKKEGNYTYRQAVIQLKNNTTGADRHGEIVFSYGPQGRVKTYTIKINQSK